MSVPIFEGNRIVAVALLGNKEEPYDLSDARRVALLVSGMSRIIQHKRAEQEKLLYTRKLEQRNKELRDFAFISSHDLQEPLRKIQVFADRLMRRHEGALNADARECVTRMWSSAKRMQDLVYDLLRYNQLRMDPGPFWRVNISDVVEAVLIDLEPIRERVGACVEVGVLPAVDADREQMLHLFRNLIGNALKFVDMSKEKRVVKIYGQSEGDSDELLKFFIEDNGIGFDEKYLELIFTPFQRLHSRDRYEGTGIGLSICRKIVERHNGTITARSRLGEGSTFIVTLPFKQPAELSSHSILKID
jgi:light-regulated signal transduction histidine kinase (bacteriophytochrome)